MFLYSNGDSISPGVLSNSLEMHIWNNLVVWILEEKFLECIKVVSRRMVNNSLFAVAAVHIMFQFKLQIVLIRLDKRKKTWH